jgi:hypothetical protein
MPADVPEQKLKRLQLNHCQPHHQSGTTNINTLNYEFQNKQNRENIPPAAGKAVGWLDVSDS